MVVSALNAKFMSIDISNFYLKQRYEHFKLKLTDVLEEVIEEYNLREKATEEGFVYVEVRKGMYGLPQAGLLAQQLLEEEIE